MIDTTEISEETNYTECIRVVQKSFEGLVLSHLWNRMEPEEREDVIDKMKHVLVVLQNLALEKEPINLN